MTSSFPIATSRRLAAVVVALASLALLAAPPAGAQGTVAQLARVDTPTPAQKDVLQTLGLDLTESAGPGYVDVVLWGAADVARLDRAGLRHRVTIADLGARTRANQVEDRAFAARTSRSALPSGSTAYRSLAQVNAELRKLAADNPGLVRLITLPEKTLQGREVLGVEISEDVQAADGKPVFLQMGVHHAREWPSAEHALEWAYEMVEGQRKGDERVRRLNGAIRTIVVPVVNPDGFQISRTFGQAPDSPDGGIVEAFSFKRKNCNTFGSPQTCEAQPTLGTDPNRNYGGLWGGPGASAVPAEADYRGPDPFSEPETRNVRALVSGRQVTTLITNHTFSNLVLRPPGVAAQGPSIDEPIYKALGDRMAAQNGYKSQLSFQLYDTTGTTEDFSYYATGGLGFTFEIGANEFHPPYEEVVAEYEGTAAPAKAVGGKGNREAYFVAAEHTADASKHSVLEGRAPAGRVLRLKKSFESLTSPVVDPAGNEGAVRKLRDTLDTTLTVPASGAFEWDINPSTRPAVAPKAGRLPTGKPSDTIELDERPATPAAPARIPFTYRREPGRDDASMIVEVTNPAPAEDYDLKLFRVVDGKEVEVGSAASFVAAREAITIENPVPGDYVLEVTNFAATGISYTARATFQGPKPPVAGQTESWTLSCETPEGRVLGSQPVVIDRGQKLSVDPCGATAAASTPSACQAVAGFRSAKASGAGSGGLRLGFERSGSAPVGVDVFQVSQGRRVVRERLVASFRDRPAAFTWAARRDRRGRRLSDGTYFVRYRLPVQSGGRTLFDARRLTVRRSRGRFVAVPGFYQRDSCGTLRSTKLTRPVFGGAGSEALGISYRLNAAERVSVTVRRGGRVVRRFSTVRRRAGRTYRLSLPARGLRRGTYQVRFQAGRERTTLTATRL